MLEIRAFNKRSTPPTTLYWGKDFFSLSLKHGSMRIKESPENKHFELHVLLNEFFRKDMPSCQGEVILEICTGKDRKGKKIWEEIGSFA
jgi:hypothetical protein